MARSRLSDVLQSHLFWAFDASISGVPVFNPLFGFSRISAPEITAELETFKDGTFLYNRSIVKGGSVGAVTFERAASFVDSDFYDWIMFALYGRDQSTGAWAADALSNASNKLSFLAGASKTSPRRNLMVVQFSTITFAGLTNSVTNTATLGYAGTSFSSDPMFGTIGPIHLAGRVPARAWMLSNCIPMRYKSSTDFDASTASVSLQELEVQPESISEFALGL